MYYEEAIGSYCNDFLEPILDTQFRYDIPYRVDKEKYNEVLKKYNCTSRFKDADVVTFSFNLNTEDRYNVLAFFVHPQNSPNGSEDFYDCIQFDSFFEDVSRPYDTHQDFIRDLLQCIIKPSTEHIREMMNAIREGINKKHEELNILQRTLES